MQKLFYYSIIFAVFSDLYVKYLASFTFASGKEINLFWDFLYLTYIKNDWIAFSIGSGWIALKLLTVVLILWFIFYYFKYENRESKLVNLGYWLIIGWAIWNWYERVFYEEVIDFIGIKGFAIFNLADAYITIWIILLIYYNIVCQKYFDQKK